MEILVKETVNGRVVSARELHEFLGVGRDFSNWIRTRISKYKFQESIDFQVIWNNAKTGGVVEFNGNTKSMAQRGFKRNYFLTLDMAKELCMIENNEKGRMARKHFIQCEKKYVEVMRSQIQFQTQPQALMYQMFNDEELQKIKNELSGIEHYEKEIGFKMTKIARIKSEIEELRTLKSNGLHRIEYLFREAEERKKSLVPTTSTNLTRIV